MQQKGSEGFAAKGIGREGGDGSAQRGQSVIYDCLVLTCVCLFVYLFVRKISKYCRSTFMKFWKYVECRSEKSLLNFGSDPEHIRDNTSHLCTVS